MPQDLPSPTEATGDPARSDDPARSARSARSARPAAADAAGSPASADAADGPEYGSAQGRRVVQLLWSPPRPSARGPRPKIRLEHMVEAAIDLADRDGDEALSMRSLARHLGVGAMSLYTYVPGKNELFELMIDRAYGDRAIPDRALPWRERYTGHAREGLAMYRRHPWLVHSNLWRLPLGPHVLDVTEDMLDTGRSAGLSLSVGVRVSSLLESYVFGMARGEIADRGEALRTGQSVDDYWEARSSFWTTHFDPARFPTMLATWESGAYEETTDLEADLDFALGLILDSVERLVEAAARRRPEEER